MKKVRFLVSLSQLLQLSNTEGKGVQWEEKAKVG